MIFVLNTHIRIYIFFSRIIFIHLIFTNLLFDCLSVMRSERREKSLSYKIAIKYSEKKKKQIRFQFD